MSGPQKSVILGITAGSYRPLLDAVHTMATKYEQHVSTFKGYVEKPGGTVWEGQTAEAGQHNVGDGWKVAARIQDLDTKFQTTAGMAVDHTIVPELVNCQQMIHNAESQRDKGVTLTEDLVMGYNPPPGISEKQAEENAQLVKVRGEELKESARKWYEAEQEVKRLAEGVMRDIENEVNGAAGTFDIGKAVKDNAPPKPDTAQDANFYKQWYPKKTDPASADPGVGTLGDSVDRIKNPPTTPTAATAPVDPNAPQYGPFAKDTIDKTKVGGLGESVTYLNRNDKPPEEHKPSAAERFKTNISEGIDKGVDKLVAPFTDLRDRLGLGDKGFWEANEEAGRREWESFKHQMTTPPGADIAEGIKHNIENPGQYFGERLVDGGALMAGGPEGLLPRAGLEQSAAHLGSMHPDLPAPGALHDAPAPAHTAEPPNGATHPAPVADHPAPNGDHPTGHLPPHGEPGSFGYDDDGNRLRYANGRPPYGSTQEVDVWNQSREDQLQRIDNQDLNLPRPGDDQQWTLLHPNGPIGDDWTVENGHRLVDWQEGQLRDGLWDMGHDGGLEYRKLRELYLSHQIDFDEFIRQHQNHENYSVQDPYRNRSHIDEHP